MPKPTPGESAQNDDKSKAAQADRERELRELIEQVEREKSGAEPPKNESAHDYVERRAREKLGK